MRLLLTRSRASLIFRLLVYTSLNWKTLIQWYTYQILKYFEVSSASLKSKDFVPSIAAGQTNYLVNVFTIDDLVSLQLRVPAGTPSGYSSINSVSPARFAKFERSITDLLTVREWGEARDTLNPTGEVTLFDRIPDDRRGRWLSNVVQSKLWLWFH